MSKLRVIRNPKGSKIVQSQDLSFDMLTAISSEDISKIKMLAKKGLTLYNQASTSAGRFTPLEYALLQSKLLAVKAIVEEYSSSTS